MKKLVSICFLSIMFLVLGVQAQQQDCCFRLNNPNGEVRTDIANMPGGVLQLNHQLNPLATMGRTDVYDLIFSGANCLGIDYETAKVSIEWELWCDGQQVTGDLSDYCTLSFQTFYNELHWIGGNVGTGTSSVQDYPGAIQQYQGTYNISNISFDYFYFKFLANTQTRVVINWNQAIRDVMLVVRVRERINGTNHELYWDPTQTLNIGGHQSHPGRLLAVDTLKTDPYTTAQRVINDCEDVVVGLPNLPFTMHNTGIYNIAYGDTSCGNRIDSIVTYNYTHYVHPTKPAVPDYTYCQFETATPIVLPDEPNPDLQDPSHRNQIVAMWSTDGIDFTEQASFTPRTDVTGDFTYFVKRHDNLTGCESEVDTFVVKINVLPDNPVADDPIVEYCHNARPSALSQRAPAGQTVLWGPSSSQITSPVAPTPETSVVGTQVYYMRMKNTTTGCLSLGYDSVIVNVYAKPAPVIVATEDTLCFKGESVLSTAEQYDAYKWSRDASVLSTDASYTFQNIEAATGFVTFQVEVSENHPEVVCKTKTEKKIWAYTKINTPTPVRGDTALCGPGTTTRTVAVGNDAVDAVWYNAAGEVIGNGLSYTANYETNTTVYVAAKNEFGCETEIAERLPMIVKVNDVPHITLTPDNGGRVCAESELSISSAIVDSTSRTFTYAWSGDTVLDPTTGANVKFRNYDAGFYTVTLTVEDGNGCTNQATIDITVDTLPIIVNGVDFTVANNDYCEGSHGSITFITVYESYTINGTFWQNQPNFEGLAAGFYYPSVEDGNGCKAHPVPVEIINAPVMPVVTTTNVGNTQCGAPYNGKLIAHVTPSATYNYKLDDGAFQADSVFSELTHDYTYTIVAKDMTTGCKDTAYNQVVADNRPDMQITADIHPNTYCVSPYDGKITVNVDIQDQRTTQYKYELFSPMPGGQQFSNVFDTLIHGSYTVNVTEVLSGCEKSEDFVVADERVTPVLTLTQTPNTHCTAPFSGEISVAVVPPAIYQFTLDGHESRQAQDTNVFNGLEQGFYNVSAKDVTTGCVGSDTVSVTYDGVLPTATINAFDNICFGDTTRVSLVTAGDVVFDKWTYSGPVSDTLMIQSIEHQQSFALPMFPAGKHNFTAHFHDTVTHCTNEMTKEVRVIPVNIDLIRLSTATICDLDTAGVYCKYFPDDTSDSLVNYTWYAHNWYYATPGVFDTIMVMPTSVQNRVSIVVVDNHGCTNSKYIDLPVRAWPTISTQGSVDYCQNSTASITASSTHAIDTYEWWKGSVKQSSSSTYSENVGSVVGDYALTLKLKDNFGCKNDTTFNINVVENPGAPVFEPKNQYFCSDDEISVDTTVRNTPNLGSFVWNTTSPNVTKAAGTYYAHYSYTEGAATCKSDSSNVIVHVSPAKINFTSMKYNTEHIATTSHARCYDETATDVLHISTNVADPGYDFYYKLNGVDTSNTMIITRTQPGTYQDTITVQVKKTNPGNVFCYDYDTVYYTLTINPLPTEPSDFPTFMVGSYPSIFYCEGQKSSLSYTFTAPTRGSVQYSTKAKSELNLWFDDPRTAEFWYISEYMIAKFIDSNNCVNTFKYDIVEVKNPSKVTVTSSLDSAYCGSSSVTGNFYAAVQPAGLVQSYNVLTYNWCDSSVIHNSSILYDTLYNASFSADTTVSVSVSVKAGGTDMYAVTCGPKMGTKQIDFQTIPDRPVLNTTVAGYIDANTVGYCANGDSLATVSITTANFTTSPATAQIYIVGGNITDEGTYKVYAKNPDGLGCTSDTLTLTVTKYRTLEKPNGFVADTAYCSADLSITLPFTAKHTNDSLAYYKGTTLLNAVPDTAGTYSVKIINKEFKACHRKENFTIHKVINPTLTVTINGDSTRKLCEGSSVNLVTTHKNVNPHTSDVKYYWNGSAYQGFESILIGKISADSIVSVGAIARYTSHSITCKSDSVKDQIVITYYKKPAKPAFTGTSTSFCAGDSLIVDSLDFTHDLTAVHPLYLNATPSLPHTFHANGSIVVKSYYADLTSCTSADTTVIITKNELPTIAVTPASPQTVCKGESVTFTASGAESYSWDNGQSTAAITVDSVAVYTVTGTDANGCTNTTTAELINWPVFHVTMSNDTLVCKDEPLTLNGTPSLTGSYTYRWFVDGVYNGVNFSTTSAVTSVLSPMVGGLPVPYKYGLEVTDEHNCVSPADSNIVNVYVFDNALFTFLPSDEINTNVGDQNSFTMIVNQNCMNPGTTVFLQFSIYKDGVLLSDDEWQYSVNALASGYNTSYDIDVTQNAPLLAGVTMDNVRYNTSTGNIPNAKLIPTLSNHTFNWFYMHFLNQREITVNIGSWKEPGTYKLVYVLRQTSNAISPDMTPYKGSLLIGGSQGVAGAPVDTLSMDWITFNVEGSSANNQNPTPTSITTLDDTKDMNMNVYPNPAQNNVNVVLEGVEGQTVVTIYDMSGKAVSSERIEVSYDGQIYTTSVSNYSQGIYFVKVVNGDAVMTKKLIIAR